MLNFAGSVGPVNRAHSQEDPGSDEDLPERRITPNQLIALNMARFRKAAGMTQEQLGEQLGGWSNAAVSAAERSWDGKRIRQFDADSIMAIAMAIGVPVAALLLPPEDAGVAARYVLELPGAAGGEDMSALLSCVLPGYSESSPAMREYTRRLIAAGVLSRAELTLPVGREILTVFGKIAAETGDPEAAGADILAKVWAQLEERDRKDLLSRLAEAEGLRQQIVDLRDFEREYRRNLRTAIQADMALLAGQLARLSSEEDAQ
jgi:transcriptional regulator with XRE-family HTH domain